MGDVAGVDHKGGLGRHSLDLGDRVTQRAERIWVSGLVEADMTVADLDEGAGVSAARALPRRSSPRRPKDFGTPPDKIHSTPVPAQIMHSSAPLRLTPASSVSSPVASVSRVLSSLIVACSLCLVRGEETGEESHLFPGL
jgi:hypothetical protein